MVSEYLYIYYCSISVIIDVVKTFYLDLKFVFYTNIIQNIISKLFLILRCMFVYFSGYLNVFYGN